MTDAPTPTRATFADATVRLQMFMLLFNVLPLLHVLALFAIAWTLRRHVMADGVTTVLSLYLPPAIVSRAALMFWPIRTPTAGIGTREFCVWWFTANCQVLFCRFPALDEALRLVPGLYSAWLRLWGSRIGKLTYWSAGTRVLDRSFLRIGDYVTFGAGVRLNGHVLMHNAAGELELALAPIEVGDRAIIGGYALLTAGTVVSAGEVTRACLAVPPFSRIEGGRHRKPAVSAV